MSKLDLSHYNAEIDKICKDPVAVISHRGSLTSGHYVVYTKVGSIWYLNDDSKRIVAVNSPFEQNRKLRETADIIVFENNIT